MANPFFRRLKPKRPSVVRNGDTVKVCHYYKGTKKCLGPMCYWPKVGTCSTFNRMRVKMRKAK